MKIKTYEDIINITSEEIARIDSCGSPFKGEFAVCESWSQGHVLDMGWRSVCTFKCLEDAFRAIHRFAPLLGYSLAAENIRGNCCYVKGPHKDHTLSIRMIHPGQDYRLLREFEV